MYVIHSSIILGGREQREHVFSNYCVFIDDSFGIWTGGLTYPQECVALLAAVVTGGHHPNSVYMWSKDASQCELENSPVIYATSKGLYVCTIETKSLNGVNITHKLEFVVRGMYQQVLCWTSFKER